MTRIAGGWWIADATRGGLGGFVGTWLMDLVTTGLLEGQSEESKRREETARPHGKPSVANLVDRIDVSLGLGLGDTHRATAAQVIHFGLGVLPGALYGALRHRVPVLGAGRGLLFGGLLWALNDEYLNTALGLAGRFDAYPAEAHWRGLVGHTVLGATTRRGNGRVRGLTDTSPTGGADVTSNGWLVGALLRHTITVAGTPRSGDSAFLSREAAQRHVPR
jgi:hypothetical protein